MICIILLGEIARRVILANSLYTLNLHTTITPETMPPPRRGEKIVVFAPHEDDETLGAGGYIQQAVKAGADVHVVLMTNGEFPEVSVVLFEETLSKKPQVFIRLGYRRQRETIRAMKYFGIPAQNISFLGYPNHYVNQMWFPAHWQKSTPVRSIRTRVTYSPYDNSYTKHAIYCGESALNDIESILIHDQPDTIVTLHPNDIHPDHWPTYTFVDFALNELIGQGQPFAAKCKVYTYLIHRDYWPVPRGYWPALNLEPPAKLARVGNTTWLALPLTVEQTIRKHKAIAMYRTQGGAYDPLLLSFARTNDLFGIIHQYVWPDQNNVPVHEVIKDAAADMARSSLNARGDIISVTMERHNAFARLSIRTRGTISKQMRYRFSIHAGGASADERIIALYRWMGNDGDAVIFEHGALHTERRISVSSTKNVTTITFPWPLEKEQRFFILRAWTNYKQLIVDQTLSNTFVIGNSLPIVVH